MSIKYHVLSIDGGGVRGIVPACFLKELSVRTGKDIHELFDLVIGTSAGGLTAIAIACKFNTDMILDLFKKGSVEIFPHSFMRDISTGNGMFRPKYSRDSLDKLLNKYFGDKLLSESELPICIPSYNLDEATSKIWFSPDAVKSKKFDAKLKDIAGATSAAPTYLPPKEFYDMDGNIHHEIDGGIFLNNPQILALTEIIKNTPDASRDEILLISMGTGNVALKWDVEELKDSGILGWIKGGNIIEAMMDASNDFANIQASIIFPNMYRLQTDLTIELGELDNASAENIQRLINNAEDYIKNNDTTFDKIALLLLENLHEHTLKIHNDNEKVLIADTHLGIFDTTG